MRTAGTILLVSSFIFTNGCSKPATNQATPAPPAATAAAPAPNAPSINPTPSPALAGAKSKVDVCSLLTSDEIKAVQGEPLKETKPSERPGGDFIVTLCYYELPTPSNSISLMLTESNSEKPGKQSLKQFWETTFGKDKVEPARPGERDKEKNQARAQGEEEESAPEPVRGLGDEAFWSASKVGGALFVLKRDRFIRISVGGKGDAEAKLKKSKTLAQKALRRL
jgi:hypothetical protein